MEATATYRRKNVGQVFTPVPLVKLILDFAGYTGNSIFQKHIIDNSCGEGAFLVEAVHRYCRLFLGVSQNKSRLKKELATYIHGIEIDEQTYVRCLQRLDDAALTYGLRNVRWDIVCANALHIETYDGRMDFVVGNPPYVRVHNLQDNYTDVKQYAFADKGMTDLYLVFYEISFRMMRENGRMAVITPSSWLTSKAGEALRTFLAHSRKLKKVIDLGHQQAFDGVSTYTLISYFENHPEDDTLYYYVYEGSEVLPRFITRLAPSDFIIHGDFYLGTTDRLTYMRHIREGSFPRIVQVKNGFATLADNVFIGTVPTSPLTIPILKASTGVWTKGLFPYTPQGTPLTWNDIQALPTVREYFTAHREELQKHHPKDKEWHLYGRTQALRDVCKDKVAVNTLIRDAGSLKINPVAPGCGLYSGLYLLGSDYAQVRRLLETDDFLDYVALLRNYKSGGYYTFSSKALEQYINYQLNRQNGQPEK